MNSCNCPSETVDHTAAQTDTPTVAHRPRFHTTEDESGVTLSVALPGVGKDDLTLTLLESNLRIEAKRSAGGPGTWKSRTAESVPALYALNLRLGSRFDGSKTTATLESGVLTLGVPFREEAKPRQIAVN